MVAGLGNAGVIAQLLTGGGAGAAGSVTSQIPPGPQPQTPPTSPTVNRGTRILSGNDAQAWLAAQGYIDAQGNPTPAFTAWMNELPSQAGSGDLQGFAGDLDANGNPIGHYAIIVTGQLPTQSPYPLPDPDPTPKPDPVVNEEKKDEPKPDEEPKPPPVTEPKPDPVVTPVQEPEKYPEPPPEPPCMRQKHELEKIATECNALSAEVSRLQKLRNQLINEYNMMGYAAAGNMLMDLGSTILSIFTATAGAAGKMGSVSFSLLQNAAVEYFKKDINEYCEQNPGKLAQNIALSEVPTISAAAFTEFMKSKIVDGLEIVGLPIEQLPAAGLNNLRNVIKFTRSVAGGIQVAPSAYSFGNTFSTTLQKKKLLHDRIDTVTTLLENSRKIHDRAVNRRNGAEYALMDCIKNQ